MLLLVTNQRDVTMDYVVAELQRRGSPYFRLNTELLPSSISTMLSYPRSGWSIQIGDRLVSGEQVTSAYFRRPGAPLVPESVRDPGERAYVEAEWGSLLKSLYTRLEGLWLNAPTTIFMAEDKPRQLMLAHEIGLHVPTAAITNNLDAVRDITRLGQAIGKPLRQAVLAGERERVIFTTRLAELSDADAQAIVLAPFIVQTEIKKKYDVRVTVVGEQVFATAILSQEHDQTTVDWRKGSRPDLKHERIELPDLVRRQCLELLRRLGIRYGAIDFICDELDCLWFLEINPNGQWAWIENLTGYPIASAIVDQLEEVARVQASC